MLIKVYPEDLVKRCVWDNYVYYILGSEKKAKDILDENIEIEISERDALVIGLLKIIETDNLIHKLNTYLTDLLTSKSVRYKDLLIKKSTFDQSIDKFIDKFPEYWQPNSVWKRSLEELKDYIVNLKSEINDLELHIVTQKDITNEYYSTNSIKKLLKFQY